MMPVSFRIGRIAGTATLFLLLTTILLPLSGAHADELSGIVTDADTGLPIIGAAVQVQELNIGDMTDSDGIFTIPVASTGEYTLRTTMPGYTTDVSTVQLPATESLDIQLTVSPIRLDDVVTTARGRQTRVGDIPGSVEVITEETFHEANPVSLPDALKRRPGLSVSSEMPWSERVVIRGLARDQVILLVDGARVVTATATAAQFGTIAHGDIERVELLKGPISVLYGSGSTGGVVNVITRKGRFTPTPQWNLMLNPTYESAAGGVSSYERAEWSSRRLYVSLSQSNRNYADYRASDDLRIPNSQFQDRQTQFNTGLRISDNNTLELRYQHFEVMDAGLPGASSFPVNSLASYPTTTRTLTDVSWTWRPHVEWWRESRVNAYYQPMERRVRLLPRIVKTVEGKPDSTKTLRVNAKAFYPEADHDVSGARWQNEFAFGTHTVVAGIEGWQKHMTSDRTKYMENEILDRETGELLSTSTQIIRDTPVPNSKQRPIGFFAEDSFSAGERMKLTVGGRIDHIHTENDAAYLTYQPSSDQLLWKAYSDDDISWSFVAGTVFKASEQVDLNLTVARSFRSPSIEERYLYAELGKLTVGDPNLDPEHGAFVETGITATLGSARLNGQVFLNEMTDMVVLQPGGTFNGQDADVYTNAGSARLTGFEATVDWVAHPSLMLTGDVSFVRGTDREQDTDLPYMPPLTGHVGFRWAMGGHFWTEPVVTMVARQDHVAPGEEETAGYGTLDIAFGRSLIRTGEVVHDFVIGLKNVTDKRYEDHLTVSRGYEMFGMGRSVYISWKSSLH